MRQVAAAAGDTVRRRDVTGELGAVLFDMDGLLVDTEPLWFETESEVMARLGAPWTSQDQAALLGGSMERSVAYLLAKATRPGSPAPARPA
jgi:beta-phosphoglucomutase-like phosphatase (HAD superfamily)